MAFNDGQAMCTTTGEPVEKVRSEQTNETGQHRSYVVLCPDERAKGFVRPVRDSYRHVGERPANPLRDLTTEEHAKYDRFGYAKYEATVCTGCDIHSENCGDPDYCCAACPHEQSSSRGRYWTEKQLASGCRTVTTMGQALAETWARDVTFYGSTFCSMCNAHYPVSEFVWMDGQRLGS